MEDSGARLKIVLLDACRSPFKGPGGGLVSMQAPAGTVIGFATQPNHTAKQGPPGGNSPYAEALAYFMGVKGLKIFAFFNEVALKVMAATNKEQVPWVSYSAIQDVEYFNPPAVTVGIPPTPQQLRRGHDDESSPPISSVRTSASLPFIQLAYKQLDNNDFAAARATLTKGIEADRNSAVAYSYRGFAWYLEGQKFKDSRSALEAYRQGFLDLDVAIKLDPSYAPVRRHRGNTIVATYKALRALRQPTNDILDRAIDDLKDAVRLDPTSETNSHALEEAYAIKTELPKSKKSCVVADPTGTPLNVRNRPNGPILSALSNDSEVFITDMTEVGGRKWAKVVPLGEGKTGWVFRDYLTCQATQNKAQVQVIEDLQLREQPDPRARNILGAPPNDKMPKGSQVAVIDTCRTWKGSGRGERDADNIWCPVLYEGHRGWANAYFLADDHGERVACVMYPTARGCASTAGR
jgi:tetratricopeptide (TPR) repeat protein